MGKLWGYVFLTVGLIIFFNVAGIIQTGGVVLNQYDLTSMEGLASFKNFDWFGVIRAYAAQLTAAVGAVAIGLFALHRDIFTSLSAGIATLVLGVFLGDLVSIFTHFEGEATWIAWFALLIGAPIVMGYVLALWEWIGGRD